MIASILNQTAIAIDSKFGLAIGLFISLTTLTISSIATTTAHVDISEFVFFSVEMNGQVVDFSIAGTGLVIGMISSAIMAAVVVSRIVKKWKERDK